MRVLLGYSLVDSLVYSYEVLGRGIGLALGGARLVRVLPTFVDVGRHRVNSRESPRLP